jgi:hypothetical protein
VNPISPLLRVLGLGVLGACPACGGVLEASPDAGTPPDSAPIDASTSADASRPDGASYAADDGASHDGGCTIGTVIDFRLAVAGGSTTRYCTGPAGTCNAAPLTILSADTGEALDRTVNCLPSCAECGPIACAPIPCIPPFLVTAADASPPIQSWDGRYTRAGTCGPQSQRCGDVACARPGRYIARICGYAESPDASASSIGGSFGSVCPATAAAPTCVDVSFAWPPESDASVVGIIGGVRPPG